MAMSFSPAPRRRIERFTTAFQLSSVAAENMNSKFFVGPSAPRNDAAALNWAISLFLIAIIALVFSFLGTGSAIASLLGGIAAISCLLLALVMFLVYVLHHHPRSGAR
jgi:uncharacterized membrane protein YtjA (UPF0391 family)